MNYRRELRLQEGGLYNVATKQDSNAGHAPFNHPRTQCRMLQRAAGLRQEGVQSGLVSESLLNPGRRWGRGELAAPA